VSSSFLDAALNSVYIHGRERSDRIISPRAYYGTASVNVEYALDHLLPNIVERPMTLRQRFERVDGPWERCPDMPVLGLCFCPCVAC